MKGTPNYLAPEVFLGQGSYTGSVDLYSLGIVLYRLLNHGRVPFLPAYPAPFSARDEDAAFRRRVLGEEPPAPALGGAALGRAVLRALAGADERYETAGEFSAALRLALELTPPEVLALRLDGDALDHGQAFENGLPADKPMEAPPAADKAKDGPPAADKTKVVARPGRRGDAERAAAHDGRTMLKEKGPSDERPQGAGVPENREPEVGGGKAAQPSHQSERKGSESKDAGLERGAGARRRGWLIPTLVAAALLLAFVSLDLSSVAKTLVFDASPLYEAERMIKAQAGDPRILSVESSDFDGDSHQEAFAMVENNGALELWYVEPREASVVEAYAEGSDQAAQHLEDADAYYSRGVDAPYYRFTIDGVRRYFAARNGKPVETTPEELGLNL